MLCTGVLRCQARYHQPVFGTAPLELDRRRQLDRNISRGFGGE
jgi:hypothetical protein